jgi:Rieske Fe-S protein
MLGRNEAYDRVPYFFSDQYDVGMEYSGDARNADELVVRGDPASREFIAFWLAQSRLVAAMNVNVWDVTDPIQSLIKSQKAVDSQSLADTQVALEDMAASVQTNPLEAAKRLISEGASYTKHFISDRLTKHGSQSVTDIQPGTGEVISLGGEQVAVYKDPQGTTHAVSAVCTHMGCIVGFNSQDQTWDCPCHGSRFDSQGQVISGPAKTPLPSRQELL